MNEFLCNKMDSVTSWIGAIGLILALFRWETGLLMLFAVLIFLPDAKFSGFFAKISGEIKEKTHHDH